MAETFAKLPHVILRRADLTSAAKLVYAVIADRVGSNVDVWAGQRRLALDCGLSTKAVNRSVTELEKAGLITIQRPAANAFFTKSPKDRTCRYRLRSPFDNVSDSTTLSNRQGERSPFDNGNVVDSHTEPDQVNQTKLTRPRCAPWTLAIKFISDDGFKGDEFRTAWERWAKHRSEIRKPLTESSVKQQIADLERVGLKRAVETIDLSIRSGWAGLFPEKSAPRPGRVEATPGKYANVGRARGTPKLEEEIHLRVLNA